MKSLSIQDQEILIQIYDIISNKSLMIMISDKLGQQLDNLIQKTGYSDKIHGVTTIALEKALDIALSSIDLTATDYKSNLTLNKLVSSGLGFAGGFFGLAGISVELPVTTTVMLRAIASIAYENGEDISSIEGRLHCIGVFGLMVNQDNGASFLQSRIDIDRSVGEALGYIGANITGKIALPMITKAMGVIFNRFGITVAEKITAQSMPLVGAIGGATINAIFMDYYQNIAFAYFSLRRLERKYGKELVSKELQNIIAKYSNTEQDIENNTQSQDNMKSVKSTSSRKNSQTRAKSSKNKSVK